MNVIEGEVGKTSLHSQEYESKGDSVSVKGKKGLTKILPDYSKKSHRRELVRHGNPWFREITAPRRAEVLRTGYGWAVTGCPGVRRDV